MSAAKKSPKAPIVITDVRPRARVYRGQSFERLPDTGHHVSIVPGESITLYGAEKGQPKHIANDNGEQRYVFIDEPYHKVYRIGDFAEHGSYNLSYYGKIVSITEKTVIIEDECFGRKRLDIYDFSRRNRRFDVQKAARRNADWMD